MDYGIQMYSVRDITAQNMEGALKAVAEMGYRYVEFAGFFGLSAETVKGWLDKYGLTVSGTHTGLRELDEDFEGAVKYHKTIGNTNIIIPGHDLSSQEKIDDFVEKVNRYQPLLEKEGISLGYHNHSHEFIPNADGSEIHEQLVWRTNLNIEIDTFWYFNATGKAATGIMDRLKDRIRVMYHSWGCKPIMEGNTCKGVIFESKEGRKAVLAKVVIDATGDADLCRLSGAPTSSAIDDECRCGSTALVYRIGGYSATKYSQWRATHGEEARAMGQKIRDIHGFMSGLMSGATDTVGWVNNWQPKRDCSKIADQTATEMGTRLKLRQVLDCYRTMCPEVFEDAFIYDIAPQLGTRGSHRIVGEVVIGSNDWAFPKEYDDTIAWHCTVDTLNDNAPIEIPYRAILPQKVDNLLAPGRHISADAVAIDNVNLIPQCVGTGQAAGVAAAVAVAEGSTAHTVNVKKVQDILAGEQDVPLPRNEHTDKSYTECLVEHEYGLYTEAAKKARETQDAAGTYRHWSLTGGAGNTDRAKG